MNGKRSGTRHAKSRRPRPAAHAPGPNAAAPHPAVARAGYGWGAGDTTACCPQGFYNPGFNTRKCTKCPGSLTTLAPCSAASQDCMAPKGSYYFRGKAVACARGTYKESVANNDCDECPEGEGGPRRARARAEGGWAPAPRGAGVGLTATLD